MNLNSDNYFLAFQNNEEQFKPKVGGKIKGSVSLKDSKGVDIPFFCMENNNVKSLNPVAGLFAYGTIKENNQVEIVAIEETDDFSNTNLLPSLEKSCLSYDLFIAITHDQDKSDLIAFDLDKSDRVELTKRLRESYKHSLLTNK